MKKNTCMLISYIFSILSTIGSIGWLVFWGNIPAYDIVNVFFITAIIMVILFITATILIGRSYKKNNAKLGLTGAIISIFCGNWLAMILAFIGYSQMNNELNYSSVYSDNYAYNNNSYTSNEDELIKYKELLDSGVITPEEFESKKKELLNI